jgi:hypothetical protein
LDLAGAPSISDQRLVVADARDEHIERAIYLIGGLGRERLAEALTEQV